MSKNFFKNLKCIGESSLSSIDDILVTPPQTPIPPPPPKPNHPKNPDLVVVGPKPKPAMPMQRTPPKNTTPRQQTNGAGASLTADVTQTTAPPANVNQQPAASTQSAQNQIPISQGSEPYVHPNGRVNNTPTTGSGSAQANVAATAAGTSAAIGAATGARPRNNQSNQDVDMIGVAVDEDEIPEEDLQVDEEIEKSVDETPEQKVRWKQLMGYTIRPKVKYQNDMKLVLRAIKNKNDWEQVAALLEQMEASFEDWEAKRVRAMTERHEKLVENDVLLAKMQCDYVRIKNQGKEFIQEQQHAQHQQHQQMMQESLAAANQNVANMEYIAQEAELRAAAAAQFAANANGISNPPPSVEMGAGGAPPFNDGQAQTTTVDEQGRAISAMSLATRESSPSFNWDDNYGGQVFWDQTSNSNAQHIDPRLTNSAAQLPKRARTDQQQSRPLGRGTMMAPGAGGQPPAQQANVTYAQVHQPPPVELQRNQQVLQGGLPVTQPQATQPQAAQLTTNQQPPQQQLPQQQLMVNAQPNYQYLAQPVPQYSQMIPPGRPTATMPPPAMNTPHQPPLHSFQTIQQQQGAVGGQFMPPQQGAVGGQFIPPNAQQQQFQYPQQLQLLWQQQQQQQLQLQLQTAQVLKEINDGNQRTQEDRNSDIKTIAESIHFKKLVIKDHVPMLKTDPSKPLLAADFAAWLRKMESYEKKFLDNYNSSTKYEELYSQMITRVDGSANLLIYNKNPDESSYEKAIQLLKQTFYSKKDLQQQTIDRLKEFKKVVDTDESLLEGHSILSDILRTIEELELRPKDLNYLFIMGFILPKVSVKLQQRYFKWIEEEKKKPENEIYPLGWDADPGEFLPLMRDHRGAIRDQTALRGNRPQQGGGPAAGSSSQQQQGRNNQGRNNGNSGQPRSNATGTTSKESCGFCKALGKTASHKAVHNCDSIEKIFKKNGGVNGGGAEAVHRICLQEGHSCRLCFAKGHKAKNCDKAEALPKCNQKIKHGKRKGETCGANHNKHLHYETAPAEPKAGAAGGASKQQQTKSGAGAKKSPNKQGGGYRRSNATSTGGAGAAGGSGGQNNQPRNNPRAPPQNLQGAMVPYQNFMAVPQPTPVPLWYSQGPMPPQRNNNRQVPDSTTGAGSRNQQQ